MKYIELTFSISFGNKVEIDVKGENMSISLKEIISSLSSLKKISVAILLIFSLGIIINNAFLLKYGIFSPHLLDIGNISTGLLFLFIIVFLGGITYLTSISRRNFKCKYRLLLLVPNILIFLIFTYFYYEETKISSLCFNVETIFTIVALIVTLGYPTFIGLHLAKRRIYSVEFKKKISNLYLIKSFSLFFLLITLLLTSILFGRCLYGMIPKYFWGGRPVLVYFESINDKNQRINYLFDQHFLLLDETNNSFLIFNEKLHDAFELPKSALGEDYLIHYLKECRKSPFRMLCVSDIHASGDKGKYPKGKENLKILINQWKSRPSDRFFFLGDTLDEPQNSDHEGWIINAKEVKGLIDKLYSKNVLMVAGNNDFFNENQRMSLFDIFGGDSSFRWKDIQYPPRWKEPVLDGQIVLIGLYVPDKKDPYRKNEDPALYEKVPFTYEKFEQIKWLESKIDEELENSSPPKLILILAHQGFCEDNPWSLQFLPRIFFNKGFKCNLNDDLMESNDWQETVCNLRKVLKDKDNDINMIRTDLPDIVILSGHIHDGIIIRKLDGIDHIV